MLDLTILDDTEPLNWWGIGFKEFHGKLRQKSLCMSQVVFGQGVRCCTRLRSHRGPHISGAQKFYNPQAPPISWIDETVTIIFSEEMDYETPEFY